MNPIVEKYIDARYAVRLQEEADRQEQSAVAARLDRLCKKETAARNALVIASKNGTLGPIDYDGDARLLILPIDVLDLIK